MCLPSANLNRAFLIKRKEKRKRTFDERGGWEFSKSDWEVYFCVVKFLRQGELAWVGRVRGGLRSQFILLKNSGGGLS